MINKKELLQKFANAASERLGTTYHSPEEIVVINGEEILSLNNDLDDARVIIRILDQLESGGTLPTIAKLQDNTYSCVLYYPQLWSATGPARAWAVIAAAVEAWVIN